MRLDHLDVMGLLDATRRVADCDDSACAAQNRRVATVIGMARIRGALNLDSELKRLPL